MKASLEDLLENFRGDPLKKILKKIIAEFPKQSMKD